jgi:hypothetical protein
VEARGASTDDVNQASLKWFGNFNQFGADRLRPGRFRPRPAFPLQARDAVQKTARSEPERFIFAALRRNCDTVDAKK